MLNIVEFPNIGDSIVEATIIKIRVAIGQRVQADEPLLDYAADKADGEISTNFEGVVTEIFVKKDEFVPIGAKLLAIETEAVGESLERQLSASTTSAIPEPLFDPPVLKEEKQPESLKSDVYKNANLALLPKIASPVAKRIAKDLKLDIKEVIDSVTETRRITKNDVHDFVVKRLESPAKLGFAHPTLPDFSKFGKVIEVPLDATGKAISMHLTQVWTTVPHAWMMEQADITELDRHRLEAKTQITNLSWTAIYIKALVAVLKRFPNCNASLDITGKRIILKKHYHIGVAVDTPKGLFVPAVLDADRKSLKEIADNLADFSERSKVGKGFSQEELEAHSFTLSNVGMFGSTGIMPIVHSPDSAILGVTAAKRMVVWDDAIQQPVPRLMLPITLGFDHRVVNGAEASQFLVALKKLLEGPVLNIF
jgi:pyruvate dehydrogenase E2 component (dihydrolipoamide acetyltransferase)